MMVNINRCSGLLLFALFSFATAFAQESKLIRFKIDPANPAQTIDNIGASGCWFSEGIGKYWPSEKKEQIAEWLFSKETKSDGSPKGIGLSAWRFNIGGGTFEQGDSSGIKDFRKRVECFQNPDGSYDWSKQAGYIWFVKKAKEYGVENLVAFSNTPPVQFTKNGRGFKTEKDYITNLRTDKISDYAGFLADVLKHFDEQGLHFNYISPINEPQWDWSNKPGEASQEGSPWHNTDIHDVVVKLDSALTAQQLSSKIMITEAGMLTYLYGSNGKASHQIQHFASADSTSYLGKLSHMPGFIGGHSYFTDGNDTNRIKVRTAVRDTAKKYGVDFWQTEYSMLGDAYKEGKRGRIPAIDCALFLAKMIHTDLVVANAAAWHLWNSYEPGNADFDTRYFLIALKPNAQHTDGDFIATKGLWAMGNFSRFIRPGMQRLTIERSDKRDELAAAQQVMLSAYKNDKTLVVVAINYTTTPQNIELSAAGFSKSMQVKKFVTDQTRDLKADAVSKFGAQQVLPPRSVTTFVIE